MARINLIVCDLCKKQMTATLEYRLAFFIDQKDDRNHNYDGEICQECFETLEVWFLAPNDVTLEKPYKSLSDCLHDMVLDQQPQPTPRPPAQIKALDPSKQSDSTRGKIEAGELNIVKSSFDKNKANTLVNKIKGSCPHHFKRYDDGKIVCVGPPDGFTGEFSSSKGCGKNLTDAEF